MVMDVCEGELPRRSADNVENMFEDDTLLRSDKQQAAGTANGVSQRRRLFRKWKRASGLPIIGLTTCFDFAPLRIQFD